MLSSFPLSLSGSSPILANGATRTGANWTAPLSLTAQPSLTAGGSHREYALGQSYAVDATVDGLLPHR